MACNSCESKEGLTGVSEDTSSYLVYNLVEIFGSEVNNPERIYWIVKDSGEIEEVSTEGSRFLLNLAKEDLVGTDISSTVFSEDREILIREMASPKEGKVLRIPIRRLGRDGILVQVDMIGTFVQVNHGPKKWLFCDSLALPASSSLEISTEVSREEKSAKDVRPKVWHIPGLVEGQNAALRSLVDNFSLWEELTHRGLSGWVEKRRPFVLFERLRENLQRQKKRFEDLHIRVEKRLEFAENRVVAIPELVIDRLLENLFDHILLCMSRKNGESHQLTIKSREEEITPGKVLLHIELIASGSSKPNPSSRSQGDYRLLALNKIIDLCEGSIIFKESERTGMVFQIDIPFDLASEALSIQLPDRIPPLHKQIMFVDDREKQRELMGVSLERRQCSYDLCSNGEGVLNKVEAGTTYDVYILDYKMPGLNGLETAKRLRTMGVREQIILISSADIVLDEEECKKAGVNEVWKKPVNIRKLLDHLAVGA